MAYAVGADRSRRLANFFSFISFIVSIIKKIAAFFNRPFI